MVAFLSGLARIGHDLMKKCYNFRSLYLEYALLGLAIFFVLDPFGLIPWILD